MKVRKDIQQPKGGSTVENVALFRAGPFSEKLAPLVKTMKSGQAEWRKIYRSLQDTERQKSLPQRNQDSQRNFPPSWKQNTVKKKESYPYTPPPPKKKNRKKIEIANQIKSPQRKCRCPSKKRQ